MKIRNILATAGLAIAALGVSTAASAQTHNGNDRHYDHRQERHEVRRVDRHYDNGRHYGWDRHHRHCRVEWRHHHRVKICR